MGAKLTIIEGNSNDKDNVRIIMVKGEKGDPGDLSHNDIIDNLTSDNANKVLSAKQGKILKDLTDENTMDISRNIEVTNYLQHQVNSLASGSPLVASSVSEMIDTSRVYVNTSDGNWYYYDGSQWVEGGVYQSTGIADGSVTPAKTSFVKTEIGSNKFNVNSDDNYFGSSTSDCYSVERNGNITHITGGVDRIFDTLHLMDVSEFNGEHLEIGTGNNKNNKAIYRIVFYNESMTVLSYEEWKTSGVTIPEGAYYCRITTWHSVQSPGLPKYSTLYVNIGGFVGYEPYRETIIIEDLQVSKDNLDSELKKELSELKKAIDINNYDLLIPDKIYMITSEPLRIYKTSLVQGQDDIEQLRIALLSSFDFWTDHKLPFINFLNENVELNKSDISDVLKIRAMTDQLGTLYGKDVTVISCDAADATNKSPKINMFGDSTTYGGLIRGVKNTLQDNGFTPTFIGTVASGTNELAEARSGYCYAQYIGYRTLNTDDTTETPLLPFLKLATENDKQNHGDWCFTRTSGGSAHEKTYNEVFAESGDITQDFYIFDYNYYLTNNNFDTPDIVTFGMGINDYWKYEEDATEICRKALTIMINQVHSVSSNIKIGVVPFPINGNYNPLKAVWLKEVLSLVDALNLQFNSNIVDAIAEYMSQSRELDFSYNPSDIDGKIQKKYTINDVIHTDLHGYREGAKPIAFYIINQL